MPQPFEPAPAGSATTAGVARQLAAGAARQGSVRDHNLGLVLSRVVDAPAPVSRADVAAATGLTRSTVSSLVEVLVAADLVTEVGPERRAGGGAGRPGIGLVASRRRVAGLGLELNVDYLAACVLDLAGAVRHREVVPRDLRGTTPARAVGALARLARSAVAAAEGDGLTVTGCAVALPGLVHAPDGLLRLAPNLGWRDVDVAGLLSREPSLAGLAGRRRARRGQRGQPRRPRRAGRRAATPDRRGQQEQLPVRLRRDRRRSRHRARRPDLPRRRTGGAARSGTSRSTRTDPRAGAGRAAAWSSTPVARPSCARRTCPRWPSWSRRPQTGSRARSTR